MEESPTRQNRCGNGSEFGVSSTKENVLRMGETHYAIVENVEMC